MKMFPSSFVIALLGLLLTGAANGEDFYLSGPVPKRDDTAREKLLEQKSALNNKAGQVDQDEGDTDPGEQEQVADQFGHGIDLRWRVTEGIERTDEIR